jgi:hypothetical protein
MRKFSFKLGMVQHRFLLGHLLCSIFRYCVLFLSWTLSFCASIPYFAFKLYAISSLLFPTVYFCVIALANRRATCPSVKDLSSDVIKCANRPTVARTHILFSMIDPMGRVLLTSSHTTGRYLNLTNKIL